MQGGPNASGPVRIRLPAPPWKCVDASLASVAGIEAIRRLSTVRAVSPCVSLSCLCAHCEEDCEEEEDCDQSYTAWAVAATHPRRYPSHRSR